MSNHDCKFYQTCNQLPWFFPCWDQFQQGNSQCLLGAASSAFYNATYHTLLLESSMLGDEDTILRAFENFYVDLLHSEPARGMFCIYIKESDTAHVSMITSFVSRLAELQLVGHHIDFLWLYSSGSDASYCLGSTLMDEFPEVKMILRSVPELDRSRNIVKHMKLQEMMDDPMFRVNIRMALFPYPASESPLARFK